MKSIALLRSGRREESEKLMNEVKKVEPCDDATLQAMTICFRELEKRKCLLKTPSLGVCSIKIASSATICNRNCKLFELLPCKRS